MLLFPLSLSLSLSAGPRYFVVCAVEVFGGDSNHPTWPGLFSLFSLPPILSSFFSSSSPLDVPTVYRSDNAECGQVKARHLLQGHLSSQQDGE